MNNNPYINPYRMPKQKPRPSRAHEEDDTNPYAGYKGINNVYNAVKNNINTPINKNVTISKPATTTTGTVANNKSSASVDTGTDVNQAIAPQISSNTSNTNIPNTSNTTVSIPGSNLPTEQPPPAPDEPHTSTVGSTPGDNDNLTDEEIEQALNELEQQEGQEQQEETETIHHGDIVDEDTQNNNINTTNNNGNGTSTTTNNGVSDPNAILEANSFEKIYNQLTGAGNNPYTQSEYGAIQALNNILANKGYSQEEINQMMSGINQNIMSQIQPELQKAEAESYARGIGQSSVLNRTQADIYGKAAAQMAQEQSNIIQQGKQMFQNAISQIQVGAAEKEKLNQEWSRMSADMQLKLSEFIANTQLAISQNNLDWQRYNLDVQKFQQELKESGLNTFGNFLGTIINGAIALFTGGML